MSLYDGIAPDGSFIHQYMQYMQPLETSKSYDFWCAVWLLSCAVGRRVVVARPHAPVYLNLYGVLCANAAITRKSTAIRRCEAVYHAAGFGENAVTVSASITPEKLVTRLALSAIGGNDGTAHIINSELVTLLGKEQYSIALPGMLTDLYDCPSIRTYDRIGSGTTVIKDVFISLLAASTPSWLVQAINPDVIEGGFTSRCLFIIDEQPKHRVAWPNSTDSVTPAVLGSVLRDVRAAAERWSAVGLHLSDAAKKRFIAWYDGRRVNTDDPFLASFEGREDHHVLRLAAFLAINDDSWLINAHHIQHAIKIIGELKDKAGDLFGTHKASRRLVAGIDKLRSVLVDAGELGVAQTDVMFKVRRFMSVRELEYALGIMHELEMVQRFEIRTSGRPKTVWRATNKILARNLNKLLTERLDE